MLPRSLILFQQLSPNFLYQRHLFFSWRQQYTSCRSQSSWHSVSSDATFCSTSCSSGSMVRSAASATFALSANSTRKGRAPGLGSSNRSSPHCLDALPLLRPPLRRPLALARASPTAASPPLWSPRAPAPDALFPL